MSTAPAPTGAKPSQQHAILQRMRDSYAYFTRCLWKELRLDEKAPLGWPELDMLEFIQHGGPKIIDLSFRGVGKTTFGTAAYSCWELFCDPNRRGMVLSKTTKKAREFIAMVRQWIGRVWFLQHLAPNPAKDHRDNTDAFDVGPSTKDKDPSLSAYGIDGQLPGSRAHFIIGDDVETMENTRTVGGRELLSEKVKEFEAIIYKGDATTRILYFGTYHHEESLYLKLPARGFVIRTWPLCKPEPGERQVGLAPEVVRRIAAGDYRASDGCLFAHRISESEVIGLKAQGRRFFAMQIQLVADLGDTMRYPLRLSDLIVPTFAVDRDTAPLWVAWGRTTANGVSTRVGDLPNLGFTGDGLYHEIGFSHERSPYEKTVAWVDPSGRGKDRTSLTIIGLCNGHLFVKFCAAVSRPGESGASQPVLQRIAALLREHGANECAVEAQLGGDQDLYATLLRQETDRLLVKRGDPIYPNGWACGVRSEPAWARGQKETRIIAALDRALASHRVIVAPACLRAPEGEPIEQTLQYQITRLTIEKGCLPNDDVVEGLAACTALLTTSMGAAPDKAAAVKRKRSILETLREMGAIPKKADRVYTHRHRQRLGSFPQHDRR